MRYSHLMQSTGRFTTELRRLMARSYDECRSCGASLPRESAAYAGYTANGSPLYVGNCCISQIDELATHVYWWWEKDKRCEPDIQLWRYMDFAKFVALLDARAMFFSRADLFGDPFEGAAGITEHRQKYDDHYLQLFRSLVRFPPENASSPPEDYVEREAQRLLTEFAAIGDRERKSSYVSCWHSNTGESEALWRLYVPPLTMGVAIETTAGALMEAFGDNPGLGLGHVQYVDFRKSYAGFQDRIFWKRKSLSHEAEVRAVIKRRSAEPESGLLVPVEIETLCRSVIPSPFAPVWFADLVASTVKRFDVQLNINSSELLAQPFF